MPDLLPPPRSPIPDPPRLRNRKYGRDVQRVAGEDVGPQADRIVQSMDSRRWEQRRVAQEGR